MKVIQRHLIVRANGETRVVTRRPVHLGPDEVAFPLRINMPDGWGRIAQQAIEVQMPEPPSAEVTT